jgi:hypothetical protein
MKHLIWATLAVCTMGGCKGTKVILDQGPPVGCAPAAQIAEASQLVTALDSLAWEFVGPYSSKLLAASDDFTISGEISVAGTQLAVPADCAGRTDCRHQVAFVLPKPLPGVTCTTPDNEVPYYSNPCAKLTISDATVRFQPMLADTHPSGYNNVPILTVLPACDAQCDEGEFRCNAVNLCYSYYETFCLLCLQKDKKTCPCVDETGVKPDGTQCTWMVSGDMACGGECDDAVCTYKGNDPGWCSD